MGIVEIRLSDEDYKEYAPDGTPEWVPFDREALDTAPFDVLHPLEQEIRKTDKTSIHKLVYDEWLEMTALGFKGVVWLAWKMAGIDTPPWAEFNISTNGLRWRQEEDDDADPPASGSSEPSPTTDTETEATTPSQTSSPS